MSNIEGVKVGDKLLVSNRNWRRIVAVERVTKLHAIAEGVKYRIANGWPAGSNRWDATISKMATDADVAKVADEARRRWLLDRIVRAAGNRDTPIPTANLEAALKLLAPEVKP